MANTVIVVTVLTRGDWSLARAHSGKKVSAFPWDKDSPAAGQYSTIIDLMLRALREEAPGYVIEKEGESYSLPALYDHDGVIQVISVNRDR